MLRKFEIIHEPTKTKLGYVYMDTDKYDFCIKIITDKNLDPFSLLRYKRGEKIYKGDLAESYLQRRILPPDRQALSQYLDDMGLKKYDLIDILDFTKGRCEMDRNYFREVSYDGFVW